ncbi:MAG TPA: antitoxin [Spirochaetia bacterium]|nr:MAG: antitoxin [Spirochaetes bacterium GWB1_36_13]HCL56662.1 antitoxin [Spirochaetia bacterium]
MNKYISIDPLVCHGKPVIINTRVLVSNILADLAEGLSFDEVIENYPNITKESIKAALQFGSELAQFESIHIEEAL